MAVKTHLDKAQALEMIYNYFKQFQNWISQSKVPNATRIRTVSGKEF